MSMSNVELFRLVIEREFNKGDLSVADEICAEKFSEHEYLAPTDVPGPPPPWTMKQSAALAAMHRSFEEYDLDTESLRGFRNPVYMAIGSLSNVAWERMVERLSGTLPCLEMTVYEGRHHLDASHTAEPERFARAGQQTNYGERGQGA